MGQTAAAGPVVRIQWHYLWVVAASLAIMVAAIGSGDEWFLNFVHVVAGLLWTGIDLFLAFVIGPILRRLDIDARRAFTAGLLPRTLFLMPTLAIIAPTAGWYLAVQSGYLELAWPEMWWLVGALAITAILGIQGVFLILPVNVIVTLEIIKPEPDMNRIGRLMRIYLWSVGFQGVMQIGIVLVMARFATGL